MITQEQAKAELERRRKAGSYIPKETQKIKENQETISQEITPTQAKVELERRADTQPAQQINKTTKLAREPELMASELMKQGKEIPQELWQKIAQKRVSEDSTLGTIRRGILGALEGASFSLGDEYAGLQNVKLGTLLSDPSKALEEYRQGRDEMRNLSKTAQDKGSAEYMAGEIAGGIATSFVPGANIAKGASTLGKAIGTGAASGAVGALGSSEADLTKGEIVEAGKDIAAGTALGAGTGGALHGVLKGAGAIAKRFRPDKSAAMKIAEETAKDIGEIEAATQTGTRKSFYDQSIELQKEWRDIPGAKDFTLRPGQATGDPGLALAELKARNFPETMSKAQAAEAKQLMQGAKILDSYIDQIAAKPELLTKSDTGNQLSTVLDNYIRNLVKERSNAAKPLYERASELLGGRKVIQTNATKSEIEDIIETSLFAPNKMTKDARELLEKINSKGGASGKLSIDDFQKMRSTWGKAARGDITIIEGLSNAEQMRVANRVMRAINKDLETATKNVDSKEAAEALKAANSIWRQHTDVIDEAATDTVKKILKTKTDEAITSKLLKALPEEVKATFKVLNKADPLAAKQVRAQLLDDVLTKASKPYRGGSYAESEGIGRLSPLKAKNALRDSEPILMAAFEGDNTAKLALRRSMQLLKRLSFGPGIINSTTAPQLALVAKEIKDMASRSFLGVGPVGYLLDKVGSFVFGALGNDKALNRVYSDPKNIEHFNEALQTIINKRLPSSKELKLIAGLARTIGIEASKDSEPENNEQ